MEHSFNFNEEVIDITTNFCEKIASKNNIKFYEKILNEYKNKKLSAFSLYFGENFEKYNNNFYPLIFYSSNSSSVFPFHDVNERFDLIFYNQDKFIPVFELNESGTHLVFGRIKIIKILNMKNQKIYEVDLDFNFTLSQYLDLVENLPNKFSNKFYLYSKKHEDYFICPPSFLEKYHVKNFNFFRFLRNNDISTYMILENIEKNYYYEIEEEKIIDFIKKFKLCNSQKNGENLDCYRKMIDYFENMCLGIKFRHKIFSK